MRFAAVFLIIAIAAPAHAAGAEKWGIGPPPAWIEPVSPAASASADLSGHDIEYLLYERQMRRAPALSRYVHHVVRVLTQNGVEKESQIEIDFEPYQRLTVHSVRILRNGVGHDGLRGARRETVQKEHDLERQLLRGTLTALIILDDVRVGDVIDYSFTIEGENPIFNGRYAGALDVAFGVPVRLVRYRVIWPAARTLHARAVGIALEPRIIERGSEREYIWERRNVAGIDHEDDDPPWHETHPWIQLSEWGSWQEVRQWAARLYDPSISPALATQIGEWRRVPRVEDRVSAAVRFVQDDVRYLGIELGPNSHRPHPPAEVFERRFGDCKDKAGLLVAILAGLGVEAHPALVATEYRKTAEQFLPSPFVFDHVIVRAKVDGRVLWLDATDNLKRGPLKETPEPPFERALVLDESSGGLEVIPRWMPRQPLIVQTELYTVRDYLSPVDLSVVTEHSGLSADHMRHVLLSKTRDELGKEYLNFYAADMPQIQMTASLEVKDDPANNTVQLLEHYRIPGFWKGTRHEFTFDLLTDTIHLPRTRLRNTPLWLHHPIDDMQIIRVKLPPGLHFKADHREIEDRFMRLESDTHFDGRELVMRRHVKTLADEVPTTELARHLDVVTEMRGDLGYRIDYGVVPSDDRVGETVVVGVIGVGCVGVIVVVIPRLRSRARRRRLEKRVRHDVGETAATALSIRDESELGKLRCSCGAALSDSGGRDEIALGDKKIRVAQMLCAKCDRRRSIYFTLSR